MKCVMAIDASLTGFAICVGISTSEFAIERFSSKSTGTAVSDRIARYEDLIASVLSWVQTTRFRDCEISLIGIENYAFSQSHGTTMGEFGGLLRYFLLDTCDQFIEPPSTTIKKFVTGSGKGDKTAVIAALSTKYQHQWATNDHYDAFAIYLLTLACVGQLEGVTAAQRAKAEEIMTRRTK